MQNPMKKLHSRLLYRYNNQEYDPNNNIQEQTLSY